MTTPSDIDNLFQTIHELSNHKSPSFRGCIELVCLDLVRSELPEEFEAALAEADRLSAIIGELEERVKELELYEERVKELENAMDTIRGIAAWA